MSSFTAMQCENIDGSLVSIGNYLEGIQEEIRAFPPQPVPRMILLTGLKFGGPAYINTAFVSSVEIVEQTLDIHVIMSNSPNGFVIAHNGSISNRDEAMERAAKYLAALVADIQGQQPTP